MTLQAGGIPSSPKKLDGRVPDPQTQLLNGMQALAEQVVREQIQAAIATSTTKNDPWPKVMPPREAHKYLGLSRARFDELASRGEIPHNEHMTKVAGYRMFLRDDLDAFAAGKAAQR